MVSPLVLSALISGAGSIAGRLLDANSGPSNPGRLRRLQAAQASRQRRRQNKQGGVIGQIVKDARQAGISPLAALGSSAAGQYSVAQSPMASYTVPGQSSTGSAVGEAVGQLGAAIVKSKDQAVFDSLALENASLKNMALRAEIGKLHAETARLVGDATSRTGISNANGSPGALDMGWAGTVPLPKGVQAQTVENEFGEWTGDFYGAARAASSAAQRDMPSLFMTPSQWYDAYVGPTVVGRYLRGGYNR